jgi:hypothetical protein
MRSGLAARSRRQYLVKAVTTSTALLSSLSLLFLAACGTHDHGDDEPDCSQVTGADEFVVGLQKTGDGGRLDFKMMSADPAPPARGDNTWVIQVSTMDSGVVGAPIDGATLTASPFMPAHQHGTPIRVEVTPAGTAGQYTLSPVNLWMPGVWETTILASKDDTTDSAVYRFCIN